MDVEADFTPEEIELAERVVSIEATIEDIEEIETEGEELVRLGAMSRDQLKSGLKNLADLRSMAGVFARRLNRKVEKRRAEK